MRVLKAVAGRAVCLLVLSLIVSAGTNKYGIADTRQVTFDRDFRIGDAKLPAGEYKVLHSMQGEDHIMVFKQLNTKKPIEARVKCTLVSLPSKADRTVTIYAQNDSHEWVIQEMVFKGDTAKHVF